MLKFLYYICFPNVYNLRNEMEKMQTFQIILSNHYLQSHYDLSLPRAKSFVRCISEGFSHHSKVTSSSRDRINQNHMNKIHELSGLANLQAHHKNHSTSFCLVCFCVLICVPVGIFPWSRAESCSHNSKG